MKIKEGFIVRNVAGSNIVVPIGEQTVDFNGIITLNETGAFLWQFLEKGADENALVSELLKEYDVDINTAKKDVDIFVSKLKGAGMLE